MTESELSTPGALRGAIVQPRNLAAGPHWFPDVSSRFGCLLAEPFMFGEV